VAKAEHEGFALRRILYWRGDQRGGRLVLKRLLAFAVTTVVGCVLAGASVAGPTEVEHFTDGPFPDEVCGVSGTTTIEGTSVFREGANGTFFQTGTFSAVFTADNGKSTTLFAAGPTEQTSPPIIDEEADTVTILTTYVGLPEKLSITNGPTLSLDAGTVTFVDVFEYTGDPEDPVGDFISTDLVGLHGPHPDLLSDFEVFCSVLEPYLLDP
jgi:hypothetical protein